MTTEQRTAYEMAFDKSCLNEVTNKGIPEEALSSPSLNAEEANLTHLPLQLVYVEKSGKITRENYPGWSSTKFCKHSVAQ